MPEGVNWVIVGSIVGIAGIAYIWIAIRNLRTNKASGWVRSLNLKRHPIGGFMFKVEGETARRVGIVRLVSGGTVLIAGYAMLTDEPLIFIVTFLIFGGLVTMEQSLFISRYSEPHSED